MKIGILTFQNTSNYGANLQAYALQETIKRTDFDCEIIDYVATQKNGSGSFASKIHSKLRKFLITICGGDKRVAEFKKNNFILSKRYDDASIEQCNDEYDKFIVGSDQVWNLNLTDGNTRYLLDFVKNDNKKNSYAASIGSLTINNKDKEILRRYLSKINGVVSVREESARLYLESELGIKSTTVLDPTLLLTKGEWEKVASPKKIKGKYVLIYQMGRSKSLIDRAQTEAKRIGAKVISIKPSLDNLVFGRNEFGAGPSEFVRLFLDAEEVFTNSFHGTVFSINFNKKFSVELLKKGDVNSRLIDILNACGLSSRIIGDGYRPDDQIDYDRVNEWLNENRKKSKDIIQEIVND